MTQSYEIAVIGAGIAGASVAAHLSQTHRTVILEMEDRPGYHTTGRSAAAYEPNYGPPSIRALTRAGRAQFAALHALTPRETLFFVPPEQRAAAATLMASQQGMIAISSAEARRRFPLLREGYAESAVVDPGTADIDVDLVHQHFLREFRHHGGTLVCNAPVTALKRDGKGWHITAGKEDLHANVVINAAGAWGDKVAALAGARPVGLQPKRRSIAVIPQPEGQNAEHWPLAGDVGETWYVKPQSGKLIVSPADATPVDPHDAYADDMTLAEGIERMQQATLIEVHRVEHTWAGLRTFAPDGAPVVGYDAGVAGFFWLVGQGGYGIQSSPGLSRLAAALVRREPVPADLAAEGLVLAEVSPARFG